MTNQSSASNHDVFFAGQPLVSSNSGNRTSFSLRKAAWRGAAWVRRVALLAAALTLQGAFCIPAQAQTLTPVWNQQSPATSPSARFATAMAYDSVHGQTVLFSGMNASNDTWLWDGTNWTQANPVTGPSARSAHAMAYDAAHGQVVMFGGAVGSTRVNETWLWDGTNWTQANPATVPPARNGAAMTYDPVLGKVVLFGGLSATGTLLADTWQWDGTNWTNVTPGTNPLPRQQLALAYDAALSRVVLFGGLDSNGVYDNDTWQWDGTTWTQSIPATMPPGRYGPALQFNAALGQLVMFGGYDGTAYRNDTWTYDGVNWTQQSTAASPSVRSSENAIVYDTAHQQLVLFAGFDGTNEFNDTWEFGLPGNFGNVNVCPSGQSTPAPCSNTLLLIYNTASNTTFGTPQVVTQGISGLDFKLNPISTTCTGITVAGACTVTVTFTPAAPGLRTGAVQLVDNLGNLLTTTPIYGIAQGPAIAFGPGTQTVLPIIGLSAPTDLALDGAGDLFIADYANVQIVKFTASGVQSTVPTTGLSRPGGVAVDGAGDLFIADGGSNPRVVEIPAGCTTSACQVTVPTTGVENTNGKLTVDKFGDIFIADDGNSRVVEVTPSGVQTTVPATGLSGPFGVAVDATGDVFIADTYGNQVVEVTPAGIQTTVPAVGLTSPENVWVDAAGDIFIADSIPNNRIVELPAGGGAQITVYTGDAPEAVVTDGLGDVFIADTFNGKVVEINRTQPPALSFATTYVGQTSTDSPQGFTIQNVGNQTLSAVFPGLMFQGSDFPQVPGSGTPADCTSTFSLTPGSDCNLSVSFTPQSGAIIGDLVSFFDNALNANRAEQDVDLYGTGIYQPVSFSLTGSGTGSGFVQSSPGGINCNVLAGVASGTCSTSLAGGTGISLEEVPNPGYTFAGWGGACASAGTSQFCNITLNSASSASASFVSATTYALTITAVGTGTGTVTDSLAQIACSEAGGVVSGTCSSTYVSGTPVTLTAAASGSSVFAGWGGDCASSGTALTCNLTVNSALSVNASFVAAGTAPPGTLMPITAGVVYGQGGSFTSGSENTGGVSATSLSNPTGLATDSNGNLYVADRNNNRVLFYPHGSTTPTRVYGQNGSFTSTTANNGGISANSLNQPSTVATDPSGNLYIADDNNRVLFYPAGSTTATRVYGQNGSFTSNTANLGGISANSLQGPGGMAVDGSGGLYVENTYRVLYYPAGSTTATRVYGQNGSFTSETGNLGGVSANSLGGPSSVALDSSGNLYIADQLDHRVLFYPAGSTTATRVYGQNGSFTTNTANNGGISANSLYQPSALALDSSGNLYVTEYLNNRVLFYPSGSTTATRVYGQGGSFTANTVNNGGINANSLNQPTGIALDPSGNLYVADIFNNRVLEYGPFGNVNVCPTGVTTPAPCSSTSTLSYYAATTTAFGVTQVVTQGVTGLDFSLASGGTCTGTVAAGNSCVVNVGFAPRAPGLRLGAVELFDNGGNPLATTPVYGIGQGPAIAFGPATPATVSTGSYSLNQVKGMVVDAANNAFIADTLNQRVIKLAANGTLTTVGTGLLYPQGLAVDGAGDLFIADNLLNEVVEVPAGCSVSACQKTVGTGLKSQLGVAVDGTGDVFIGDFLDGEVAKVPANGGAQTVVYNPAGSKPVEIAVDGAGNLYVADLGLQSVVEVPAGCATSSCQIALGSGWQQPDSVAVDAAGDVFVADDGLGEVVEIPAGCACQTVVASGIQAVTAAVDWAGDIFIPNESNNQIIELTRSQPTALGFAVTNVGSTSSDSPQSVSIQNVGNTPLTGSVALSLGANFLQNVSSTCGSGFSLIPGATCTESFSFAPQSTGYLTGSATFSDNTFNLSPLVVAQAVNLSGSGGVNGLPVTVAVPNVVGMVQTAATPPITGAGLALGTVSTASSEFVPSGSVIEENPAAGTQVSIGATVSLLISTGLPQPPAPDPLSLENNYFVTGDYVSAGVTLRGTGIGGKATGAITIPTYAQSTTQGVPAGADIVDAFLYWETLENTPAASSTNGTFNGYPIAGQQIGNDIPNYTDGAFTGIIRAYRADVNIYLPVGANGIRFANGNYSVSLPDSGGTALPLTEGASLVIIYRVLSPDFPLKSVVIYDGSAMPAAPSTQVVQGFYDAVGGANGTGKNTNLFASGGIWNNSVNATATLGQSNQFSAPLNPLSAYTAVILSTPVNNSDNDGILDAWKAGPAAGDFHAGQPGYYDVKSATWVGLPGAKHGQKDLFVQMDYMCGAVLANGACDPTQENLYPSPDSNGNDPLAMVQQAFANSGVVLHLEVGNAVPETTCTDNLTSTPAQLCQFPSQAGVIGWKNSLEYSKLYPRNLASCLSGGDCTTRFPYGQKDSYHYVLLGHSLTIPAYNTRYATLTSISVVNNLTTIGTVDRGKGINACPSRITIEGVLGNPALNGVYNVTGCADTMTITASTPGVPNWSYPNSTLPEPVIGITSSTVTSISGYSDLGGADSAVTLGLWLTAPNQDMSKRANVIAGTMFHEIGHTLGLSHGGLYYDTAGSYVPTFEANCKPNYQSIMNYLFQLDGVGPNLAVAYSNQTLNTLNENTAGSVTQLTDGSGNPATFPTSAWYVPYITGSLASPATLHCDGTPITSGSAYRVDASIAPITPAWTNGQDLDFIGVLQTQERGFNDLTNMDLRQIGATGGEFASLATQLSFGSSVTPLNIASGGNVTLGSGGTVTLGSGGSMTLGSGFTATLGSGGNITLGSGGNVTLGSGGNVTLGSGATITPGSTGTVGLGGGGNVTLGSGGTITLGSGGTVTLGSGFTGTLGSGGSVTLGSSGGTITLGSGGSVTSVNGGSYMLDGSGGTITLGSGGSVTLGSGFTATLGSGGTVTLGSGGSMTLGSGFTATLGSGGNVTLGSGGTVTLGSGGNVTLGSGGTITLGSGGNITLGSGGNVTLGSGGTVTLGSGGNVTLGSGGNVTLGSGGTATLGSGGTVTLGSGGTVTLGSGGNVTVGSGFTATLGSGGTITAGSNFTATLGSGGTVTPLGGSPAPVGPGGLVNLSSGGTVTLGSGGTLILLGSGGNMTVGSGFTATLGSGGTITLGSGGNVTLGSGGVVTLGTDGSLTPGTGAAMPLATVSNITPGSGGPSSTELTYETANSVVRPPVSPAETSTPAGVRVDWNAPSFGVVATYLVYRSSNGATPTLIGSVSGVNGNPPATEFIDTNPDLTSQTVVYTIVTVLVADTDGGQRQSQQSAPAVIKNDQTITLGLLPSSVVITSPPTVTATAMSNGVPNGLQVVFSATGSCSIGNQSIANNVSSATVALNSTGSCTVTASQAGTTAFNAANSVSGTFMVLAQGSTTKSQTITFAQLPSTQYGNTFSLSATSSSGETVSFMASGPCTTSGNISGVGVCTITASAPVNGNYSAASLTQSFTIYPAVLKVTATSLTSVYGQALPSLTYGYSGFVNGEGTAVVNGVPALSTTATSGSSAGSYPITVSTGTLASTNYSFLYVSGTLTVQGASQSPLTLNTTSPLTYNQSETLSVTGGSTGGTVTYNLVGGLCTLAGNQLTANSGTGTCQVTATMAGNGNYSSVTSTPANTVNLLPASQTIAFTTNPPSNAAYNSNFSVVAAATSGSAVTFTSSGVCTNSNATYKMTSGSGTCSVIANQAGNSNYAAAPQVTKTVTATPAAATISISNIPSSALYNGSFTPTYSYSGNGMPMVTSSTTSVCKVSGTLVSFVGVGTCTLTASAAPTTNYLAATGSAQSFTVVQAPAITSAVSTTFTVGTAGTFTVTATGYPAATITETGALPGGVTFVNNNNGTGTLSGKATVSGIYPITFTAQNGVGSTTTQSFTLTVETNVPASATTCNGVYIGTFSGSISVSNGQNCIFVSGGVSGNITETGGSLKLSSATIGGNIQVNGGTYTVGPSTTIKGSLTVQSIPNGSAQNQICGTSVGVNLVLQSVGTATVIGSGTTSCPANTIGGNVTLQANSAAIGLTGNIVKGSLTDQSNSASTTLSGNTVSGSLTDQGNGGATVLTSNLITGSLVVQSNTASSVLSLNTIGANLTDQGNTGPAQVSGNKVTGTLLCQSNTSITGSGNTASKKQGQCSTF